MSKLEKWKDFLKSKLERLKKVEDSEDDDEEKKYEKKIEKKMGKGQGKKFKEASKRTKQSGEEKKYASKIEKKMGKEHMKKFLEASRRSNQDFKIINDFMTTDFQVINDSMLGGYVVRDGPYPYRDTVSGKTIIKYKDWDNLKEAYGNLDKVIGYGSKSKDSHHESDDRMIGYWDTFKFIEKGMPGIYAQEDVASHDPEYNKKMDIDPNYNRVWSKLNTDKDITELSDLKLEDLKKLPVSAKYEDLGYGQIQKVGKVYHIATSLNKNEQDRCSILGTACNVSVMDTIDDQNIKGVLTHDFDDINKGVLSSISTADLSQPPTNKNKKGKAMGKKKKDKDAEEEEIEEEEEEEIKEEDTIDVADGENKIMKGGEKKYPKGKVDGDDPEVEEKIKGSPYQENQKIGEKSKDLIDSDAIKDMITDAIKEATEKVTKDAIKVAKKATEDAVLEKELLEDLTKDPYGYSEDYLKDKSVEKLKEIKEDFKQSKAYKDFIEQAQTNDFAFGEVNKNLFDEGNKPRNILKDFIESSQEQHWGWSNPKTRKDFFKEGV